MRIARFIGESAKKKCIFEKSMDHTRHGHRRESACVLIAYMVASSSMLLLNKMVIVDFPRPFFILGCQFAVSAAFARVWGWISDDESLQWNHSRAMHFIPASLAQVLTISMGIKALQYANVESFITARASTPMLIAGIEYTWMSHHAPSTQSFWCLVGILVGGCIYGFNDAGADPAGYVWIGAWYIAFCVDQTYLKRVLTTLGKDCSTLGSVFYTNFWGLIIVIGGGYTENVRDLYPLRSTLWLLAASCCTGIMLAMAATECRKVTTPVQFAIIGNVCKIMTIIANWLVWDRHCTVTSLCGLLLALVSSFYYQPSSVRTREEEEETTLIFEDTAPSGLNSDRQGQNNIPIPFI